MARYVVATAFDFIGVHQNYEKGLAQALYSYVRAGRVQEAIELCRKAHQPWRAASLRGSLLFQWRAISVAFHNCLYFGPQSIFSERTI